MRVAVVGELDLSTIRASTMRERPPGDDRLGGRARPNDSVWNSRYALAGG